MNGGFDEERFRALMALEEMLERPVRPLRPEPVWEIRREAGAAAEMAEELAEMPGPAETMPEAAGDAEPADEKIEKAEQVEPAAGEPPEELEREVLYRVEEPELPAAGRERAQDMEEPAAARDVRYRVETAGTERAAPVYRVELPVEMPDRYRAELPEPVWTGELPVMEESGPALGDQARAAVQTGRREKGLRTVQLVQEVQDKESGPSLRDWDRYWEREERRYDGGFFLF